MPGEEPSNLPPPMPGGGASVAKIRRNSKKDSMASWEREKLPASLSEVRWLCVGLFPAASWAGPW